jgi:hypothetical protein
MWPTSIGGAEGFVVAQKGLRLSSANWWRQREFRVSPRGLCLKCGTGSYMPVDIQPRLTRVIDALPMRALSACRRYGLAEFGQRFANTRQSGSRVGQARQRRVRAKSPSASGRGAQYGGRNGWGARRPVASAKALGTASSVSGSRLPRVMRRDL